jgi:6-phosphogluconolactonase
MVDIIYSDQESAPKMVKFSEDGKYLYVLHEIENSIDVYTYKEENNNPEFERIQSVSTVEDFVPGNEASSGLTLTFDFRYLVSTAAGENTAVVFEIDKKTGLLEKKLCLPISGEYPKDAALFPDNKHLLSLNHESNSVTFFNADLEKGLLAMSSKELYVDAPNCVVFHLLNQV